MQDIIKQIIEKISGRNAVSGTPERVQKAFNEFFAGYRTSDIDIVTYSAAMDQMVVLSDIPFVSFCEHHCLPIVGHVGVGYISTGDVLGISKIARVVDLYAQRFQLQERMTREIAEYLNSIRCVQGVGVYVKAQHFCMAYRGVKKSGASLITRFFSGCMKDDRGLQDEFLRSL